MEALTLTLLIVLAGAVYLRGWLHRRSIPVWRVSSFFLGLLATWVAVASPIASLDSHMLTAHMIQHLLLMTIAPPLIWLGEPLLTAQHDSAPPVRAGIGVPVICVRPTPPSRAGLKGVSIDFDRAQRLGRLLGHPAFCWLAAAVALIVWHAPAVFALAMHLSTWHLIEHASFLTTGLLFWWPVIEPWPSVPRWPRWSMLLYLFLATVPCDVLSGLLVFSDRVVYPMYREMPQMGGLSPLEDQQCAAALMWTCVTVVFLVAGTILSMQILSPKPRLQEGLVG